MIPTNRNTALPDPETVGDDQISRLRSHRQDHHRWRLIVGIEFDRRGVHSVVGDEVENRQRCKLHAIQLDAHRLQRSNRTVDRFLLHREQTDFGVERDPVDLGTTHLLIVPDHVIQLERDLLLRFILDDVRNLLRIHWRWLEKTSQPSLARYRHRYLVALNLISREELLDRVPNQLLRVSSIWLTQDFRVLDVIECLDFD